MFECSNSDALHGNLIRKAKIFIQAPWSKKGYQTIKDEIIRFRPDIMHVYNYWVMLSPSIFCAAKELNITTVLRLPNYRLACPGGMLMRNTNVCKLCIGKNPWRVIWYRCYRNSLLGSIARYRMHKKCEKKYVWQNDVDAYIAISEFGKNIFLSAGLPENKLYVKPNFMADPLDGQIPTQQKQMAIFVGRLSPEKGLKTLIHAWQKIDFPLLIVGDGTQLNELKTFAPPNVRFIGQKSHAECLNLISKSKFMIFPSECYEGFGLSLLEAMAHGKAVIASGLGPRRELVDNGTTGLLYKAGDVDDLRKNALVFINNPQLCFKMGKSARLRYLEKYTPEINYKQLMLIYEQAIAKNNTFNHV
ncbi:glycosyltransferase family 4 protein [Planctomycetota bacterium]